MIRDESGGANPEEGGFARFVRRAEEVVFTVIVALMIVFGILPVILRHAGLPGIPGTDVLNRHMLLWIALLGAGTAVRERSSVSIDLISHLVSPRRRLMLRGLTEFVAAIFTGVLVWVGTVFVRSQSQFDTGLLPLLSIPEWWLSLALPAGFLLLALRLVCAGVEDLSASLKKDGVSKGKEGG